MIRLHPLAILNISDHHTRTSLSGTHTHAVGALLGTDGHVSDSFELPQHGLATYLAAKTAQYRQVFPALELVGWYAVGALPLDTSHTHALLRSLVAAPLFLRLDPLCNRTVLPITIHECGNLSVQVPFLVETLEAERVAVEHAVHSQPRDAHSTAHHLASQGAALSMLAGRIKVLLKFVLDSKTGIHILNQRKSAATPKYSPE